MSSKTPGIAAGLLAIALTSRAGAEPALPPSQPSSGFEIVAAAGLNDMGGDADDDYGIGGHLEILLGARLGRRFSLHAGVSLDVLDFNSANQFQSYTSILFGFTVVPTFHFGSADTELVIGPKVGLFVDAVSAEQEGRAIEGSATGLVWGLNAAVLFRVGSGDTKIGPLLGWQSYEYDEFCQTIDGARSCAEVPPDYNQSLVSLSLAAWF